jgi:diacylglycerol kinase family enzyme
MRMRVNDATSEGVTAIAQNSDPFSYFGNQPLHICENAALDNGTLSVAMLRRAAQRDVPTIATRVLMKSVRTPGHRQIDHFDGVTECRVESVSKDPDGRIRAFPVQVDGDYIGDHGELELGIEPGALAVIA